MNKSLSGVGNILKAIGAIHRCCWYIAMPQQFLL
jgi:hypothetical protein